MRIALFSLLLSMGALGLSVFQYQHFLHVHPPIEAQLEKQEKSILGINQNIVTLQDSLKKVSVVQTQALNHPVEPVKDIASQYALYDIAAMIRLSVMQLEFTQNTKIAVQLLKSADKKIETIKDDRYKALREALLKDIMALDSIILPDTQGIWLKLGAILQQVDKFPTQWNIVNKKEAIQSESEHKQSKIANSESTWKQALNQGWHELRDLVKIQRHDKPITPLLSEEEQALAVQHLKLILEQARWAVLNVEPKIYASSIEEAQQYLSRYFETSDGAVEQAMQVLKSLESVDIKPTLPNLQETVKQLKAMETQEAANKT